MPLPLAAIGLGISAVGSLAQAISGESRRVKAKRALENFQRQELKNVTEGLRVSTLGAELQTEAAQQRFATSVDALRSGGVRGLVGGLGRVEQAQGQQQRVIAADLDRQQMQIDRMGAMDEARIRQMQEQRESAQIAGLGSEMAAGARSVQAGLGSLVSTGIAGAQMAGLGLFDKAATAGPKVIDLATGGKATQGLISSQPNRFMETTSGVQDLSKTFGFTRDIGSGMLSTETPSLMNTYINAGDQFNYGLKPR